MPGGIHFARKCHTQIYFTHEFLQFAQIHVTISRGICFVNFLFNSSQCSQVNGDADPLLGFDGDKVYDVELGILLCIFFFFFNNLLLKSH